MEDGKQSNKRARVDSEGDSPELKMGPVNSDYDSGLNSPEAKRIREDLLDILDDSDMFGDRDPAIQGLDSVIRSFEEEILVRPSATGDLTSDAGESPAELGYLLEASDDELGLPPTFSSGEQGKNESVELPAMSSDSAGIGKILGFEDEVPSYDSLGFGVGDESDGRNSNNNNEFVTLGRLFDYSEAGYDPSDLSDFPWRPETLPAL